MKLGAVTYNILKDWDLDTIIRNLEAAGGFEAVELRTSHRHGVEPSIGPEERQRVKARFAASKIRLLSFGSTCEFHSPDAAERARQVAVAKTFVDLAHDTGAWGVKVRPNAWPKGVERSVTIEHISSALREVGEYGRGKGVEIWLEVHGSGTQMPSAAAAFMKATNHPSVGLCWNSNAEDVVNGSVSESFQLLRPWIRNCHINELVSGYPYRELFALLRKSGYDRYTLCECLESKEPERFLKYYQALWKELNRP